MSVIVTGSSGFLGNKIVTNLTSSGVEVVSLKRNTDDSANTYGVNLTDQKSVNGFISGFTGKVQSLVHCAAVTPWSDNPDFSQDLMMAESVVNICNKLDVGNLLFLSGWIVYDVDQPAPYSESTPTNPANDYGKSKLKVENYFKNKLLKTKLINLRLASIYGPGQTSAGLIPNLTKSALTDKQININSKQTKRDYLYINDLVDAVAATININATEHIDINIGSGKSVSVLEVAETIQGIAENITGESITINFADEIVESSPIDNQLDISKAKSLGVIKNPTQFEQGVEEYVKWVKDENIF